MSRLNQHSQSLWPLHDDTDLTEDPAVWQLVVVQPARRYTLQLTILGLMVLACAGIGGLMLTETQKAMPTPVAPAPVAKPKEATPPAAAAPAAVSAQPSVTTEGGIAIQPASDPAVLKLQKRAAKGDAKAQLTLAEHYQSGRLVPADPAIARALMNNAAAAGYAPAMYALAESYADRTVENSDLRAAIRWYEAAAATGHASSAYKLGNLYETGATGAPDPALALGWYQRAASYGSDAALAGIARLTPKHAPLTEGEIAQLQQALTERGYDAGPANGKMGTRTAAAIRAYQAEIGVMEDGRASRFLLERLLAARAE